MSAESLSPENEAWRYKATFSERGTKVRLTRDTAGVFEQRIWCNSSSIGEGGFGKVFLQRYQDPTTGKECLQATKRVNLSRTSALAKYVNRELKALIMARDYPELFVMFHGWYQDNGKNMFIVMDYVPGGDLDGFMRQDRESAKAKCHETTKQLLVAIEVLHKHKICHRDLKPSNVLIASTNPFCIKICDFGIAKGADASGMVTDIGTRRYMAPEMARTHLLEEQALLKTAYSNSVDIWAIGVICHELYTGYIPFWDPAPPAVEESWSTLPSGVDPVLGVAPAGATLRVGELRSYCLQVIPFPEKHLEMSGAPYQLKDLIKLLLKPEPSDRPGAELALKHPWIASSPTQSSTMPPHPVVIDGKDSDESDMKDRLTDVTCPYCTSHAHSLIDIREHILRSHVRQLQCMCGKRFGINSELADHIKLGCHQDPISGGEEISTVPQYVLDFAEQIQGSNSMEELRSVMFDGDIKAYDLIDDTDSLYWTYEDPINEEI